MYIEYMAFHPNHLRRPHYEIWIVYLFIVYVYDDRLWLTAAALNDERLQGDLKKRHERWTIVRAAECVCRFMNTYISSGHGRLDKSNDWWVL